MKRSIKILAGTILFVMLVIITHYTVLFAMKRSGKYTDMHLHNEYNPTIVYPENIRNVSIQGFSNVLLVRGDTFYFSYEDPNPAANHVKWTIGNGLLAMRGDTTYTDTMRDGTIDTVYEKAENTLTIYLTGREKVALTDCSSSLRLNGEFENLEGQLFNSSLNVAWLDFERREVGSEEDGYYYVKSLRLDATGSSISLGGRGKYDNINLHLKDNSSFADEGSEVKNGTIGYDITSSVNMTGFNIPRLQLKKDTE
jgi:hypothetical protein